MDNEGGGQKTVQGYCGNLGYFESNWNKWWNTETAEPILVLKTQVQNICTAGSTKKDWCPKIGKTSRTNENIRVFHKLFLNNLQNLQKLKKVFTPNASCVMNQHAITDTGNRGIFKINHIHASMICHILLIHWIQGKFAPLRKNSNEPLPVKQTSCQSFDPYTIES